MAGIIKKLKRSEGVTVSAPQDLSVAVTAEALLVFADDAAYVSNKGSAAADGDLYYNSTSDVVRLYAAGAWTDQGSGGGSGINYIDQNAFAIYADAAGNKPVDGTGGSGLLSVSVNASEPLVGAQDILISRSAVNSQGSGVSWDFAVDNAFSASPKLFEVSFYYKTSTDFAYGDFSDPVNDPSDLTVWIYDVDESQLIEPSTFALSGSGEYRGTFQPNAGSLNYRLIIHCPVTTALSWNCQVDSLSVGPQVRATGMPAGDIEIDSSEWSYTNDTGLTITETVESSRHGEYLFLNGVFSIDGTGTDGAAFSVNLPSRFTPTQSTYHDVLLRNVDNKYIGARIQVTTGGQFNFVKADESTANAVLGNEFGSSAGALYKAIYLTDVRIPITGWSANTIVSSEGETRIVAAAASDVTTAVNFGTTQTYIQFGTEDIDTHNTFIHEPSGTTRASDGSYFTAPVGGIYKIDFQIGVNLTSGSWSTTDWIICQLYKNATEITRGTTNIDVADADSKYVSGSALVEVNAGDSIALSLDSANTNAQTASTGKDSWFNINRVSGPSSIAASEVIAAKVIDTDAVLGITTGTEYFIKFNSTIYDTHNTIASNATGTTEFTNGTIITVPSAGFYHFNSSLFVGAGDWTATNSVSMRLRQNGVEAQQAQYFVENTDTGNREVQLTSTVKCSAGDRFQISLAVTSGASNLDILNALKIVKLEMHRLGGVM